MAKSRKQLTADQEQQIYTMLDDGKSIYAVAKGLGFAYPTVKKYSQRRLNGQADEDGSGIQSEDPAKDVEHIHEMGASTRQENYQQVPVVPKTSSSLGAPVTSNGRRATALTQVVEEANTFAVVPKRYEFASSLLWNAKAATEREWNWPELDLGDWLDTFLYEMMKRCGVMLRGYYVVNGKQEEIKTL